MRSEKGEKSLTELGLLDANLWKKFCQRLEDAQATLLSESAPRNIFDQAEGHRYLSRLIRLGLEIQLESGDPLFPTFYRPSHETAKIGGDNPDNLYLSSTISGEHDYLVTGNVGSVAYLSFGSKANRYAIDGTMHSTGEVLSSDLTLTTLGNFNLYVSQTKPKKGDWLPLEPDSSMLQVRQTFLDRKSERPAKLTIKRISDGPEAPGAIEPEIIATRLMSAADFVVNTSKLFVGWAQLFMTRPNEMLDWGQDMFIKAGGDPAIFYVHGYWALKENQALIIETSVPECDHWNIQVNNWWMESLDYRYHDVVVNKHSAKLNDDGTATIVVAHTDPGFGNWLPTVGHEQGFVLLRWVKSNAHPVPTCRVIDLKS